MSDVLILGASARAAVHSARRAGLAPHAADLFADRDATAYATVRRCDLADYPDGLERLAEGFPPMPWLYTGGLENHPELVDRVAAKRPLCGNAGGVLRKVRGKAALQEMLDRVTGIPQVVFHDHADANLTWLRKSYGSSGGLGVSWATDMTPRVGSYLQEFILGQCYSASHFSRANSTSCLGVTEQLVGTEWLHAKPFSYAGNIGPYHYDREFDWEIQEKCGRTESWRGLEFCWGIDLVDGKGFLHLVDVNPRYTASMEVLEHATGRCALDGVQRREPRPGVVGKAVYYAPHALRFPEVATIERAIEVAADPWALPEYADIPHVGSVIDAGQPVLSFFERAADAEACREALKRRAAELDALFVRHRVEVSA